MLLEPETLRYIQGKEFSDGYHFSMNEGDDGTWSRVPFILDRSKGKRVIHFGCTDHIDVIHEKIKNNTWLHGLLSSTCSDLAGIDINAEAIKVVKECGYDQVFLVDIEKEEVPEAIRAKEWDLMVMGEIVEHVPNPVEFLSHIRSKFKGVVKELMITVPNALSYMNFHHSLRDVEVINSDHVYWFTPYTITKVVDLAGYKVRSIHLVDHGAPSRWPMKTLRINRVKRHPLLKQTVVVIASL